MIRRILAGRLLAAMAGSATLAAACALNDPPPDSSPTGSLPQGVTVAPASPQTGPVTSPTSPSIDPTPMPSHEPMGNFVERGSHRVHLDSATRVLSARLDSVIVYGNRDITKMPIPLARGLIQTIAKTLHVSKVTRVHNVAVELDSLDMLLAQSPIDGKAVGRRLQRLSGRAAAASPEAGVLAGRVAHLADVLEEAGNRLVNAP